MYKVAIVTRKMITGGIEKSLISMLEALKDEKVEITLFLMASGGELEKYIPKGIEIKKIFGNELSYKEKILNNLKKEKFTIAIKKNFYLIFSRITKRLYKEGEYIIKTFPKNNDNYDLAIAYHTPASFPVIYVSEYLNAKKKIAWIHSDVEVYKKELKKYIKYYKSFDKIYCVSEYALGKFNKQYPKLANKTDIFLNIINKKQIEELAQLEEGFNDKYSELCVLTVGRLTEQKGYDKLPEIILKILSKNIDIKWYCIGDGKLRSSLQKKIKDNKLENKLILLGTKVNPYPYFKSCDIYVQPSRHEGYCITLAEAKIFNKPIITTDFVGAREQIENNKNGLVVKFDSNDISECIMKLYLNKSLREKFCNNLKEENINRNNSNLYNINRLIGKESIL